MRIFHSDTQMSLIKFRENLFICCWVLRGSSAGARAVNLTSLSYNIEIMLRKFHWLECNIRLFLFYFKWIFFFKVRKSSEAFLLIFLRIFTLITPSPPHAHSSSRREVKVHKKTRLLWNSQLNLKWNLLMNAFYDFF